MNLEDLFQILDVDKDGKINFNDLSIYFKENGIEADVVDIFGLLREMDYNKNGKIDIKEFKNFLEKKKFWR